MAKFYVKIGYVETIETSRGVWEEKSTEKVYAGDVIRDIRRWENKNQLNDDLNVNHVISIVADSYASQKFFAIRYVNWKGVLWKVTTVEVQSPRLILTLGGVYNGTQA